MRSPDVVFLCWCIVKLVVDLVGVIYLVRRFGGG